jgi:hypothetical protein
VLQVLEPAPRKEAQITLSSLRKSQFDLGLWGVDDRITGGGGRLVRPQRSGRRCLRHCGQGSTGPEQRADGTHKEMVNPRGTLAHHAVAGGRYLGHGFNTSHVQRLRIVSAVPGAPKADGHSAHGGRKPLTPPLDLVLNARRCLATSRFGRSLLFWFVLGVHVVGLGPQLPGYCTSVFVPLCVQVV